MPIVLGGLAVALPAFLCAVVLIGLSQAAASQRGTGSTGGFYDFITGRAYLHAVGDFAGRFARWIVSHFAAGQLVMLARWFGHMAVLTSGVFTANPAALEALVHAIERVMHRGDPRARHKAATANRHAIHATHVGTHANVHARSVGHALDRYKGRTNPQIRHLVHETTVALPRDIARVKHRERWAERQLWKVRDRVKGLEDGARKTWDWITDHPFSATTAAFAGAVAVALGRLGLDAIRCPSLKNMYGKRGCGMWDDLDALLGLVATAVVAANFEELVRLAQSVEEETVSELKNLWNL